MNRLHNAFAHVVALLGSVVTVIAEDDFASELPRIPATEPAETLANFLIADGFEVDLVATEPLINSPVAIEWDAQGAMYVCEMRGYSEDREQGISRITRLVDDDQDGVYDRSTVFADGLMWPTAIFPYDGGLFVGDAPNLYYFRDVDADGKADEQQTVLTGFGTSNVQGLMNSFRWGLDNRIHVACSSVGGKVRRPTDPESTAVNVRGRDISIDPRSFQFQLTSGAAQHGMCFDDWGRKFVSSNSNHIQQVMYEDRYIARNPFISPPGVRLMIAKDGPQAEVFRASPVEPWRIVRTRLRVNGLVPGPVEGGGRAAGYFTGATGVTIYRGDAWPDQWEGLAVIGDVGSNLVHRKRMTKRGVDFIAERIDQQSEFLSSSDIWFRPAQFANAPDGTLYVVDVCREVIEHPKSLPPEIKKHLDLTAGRDRGRIYRILPTGFKHRPTPNFAIAKSTELVDLLSHPNAWHRETAARLLFERQDDLIVDPLKQLARSGSSALGRLHALHVLSGMEALDGATLMDALADSHPQVRRHAVQFCEQIPMNNSLESMLVGLADDESIDVRYQLGFTIGSIKTNRRNDVLAQLIRKDDGSVWMQTAVQSSLGEGASEVMLQLIRDGSFRSAAAANFLRKLAAQVGQQDQPEEIEKVLRALSRLNDADAGFGLPIIGEFLRHRQRTGSHLAALAARGELAGADKAAEKLVFAAMQVAADESLPVARRQDAITSLAFGEFSQVSELLIRLLDNRHPAVLQSAAIRTLGKFESPQVASSLLVVWRGLSPQLRQAATEVLFARNERVAAVFDAIESKRIAVSDVPRERLIAASKSKRPQIRQRAEALLATAGSSQREEVLQAYRESLTLNGDVERGRAHFKKHCSACHKVGNVGHEIGPSLASIKTRGAETILVNVLDPNREVNPQYLNYVALTGDGRTMTGMIAAESASSITLKRAEAVIDTVLRVDLEQLQSTGLSIMPEGLEQSIDTQAMADIITYLMQVE